MIAIAERARPTSRVMRSTLQATPAGPTPAGIISARPSDCKRGEAKTLERGPRAQRANGWQVSQLGASGK